MEKAIQMQMHDVNFHHRLPSMFETIQPFLVSPPIQYDTVTLEIPHMCMTHLKGMLLVLSHFLQDLLSL